MSCSCQCDSTTTCTCPDHVKSGEIVVMDDNCKPRRLLGQGVAYADEDGFAQLTDGSETNGLITLDPPTTPAGAAVAVLDKNGVLLKIDQLVEGHVFMVKGGQLVLASNQDSRVSFDPSLLRDGIGRLAAFICGPNNSVQLGRYDGCADGVLGFTSDTDLAPAHTPYCYSWTMLALKMVEFMCAQIPELGNDDVTNGNLVCTQNGIRKGEAGNSKLWLETWSLVIGVHSFGISPVPVFGTISYYLPLVPGAVYEPAGPANVTTAFNLTTIPGYDPVYKNAIMRIMMKGTTFSEFYDAAMLVNDIEWSRVALSADNSSDSDSIYFVIPIPANGIINAAFRYQTTNAGQDGSILALMYCVGFEK